MWAPVARAGLFLVKQLKLPLSQASLITPVRIFPSRRITFKTDASSDSYTRSLLSVIPGSCCFEVVFLVFFENFVISTASRTDQIRPSPLERPLLICSSCHTGSTSSRSRLTCDHAEPFRPLAVWPTRIIYM